MTVIWSSPPMVARTARISGSPNAAFRSAARSSGLASRRRVVGYSTGSRPSDVADARHRLLVHGRRDRRGGERRRDDGDPVAGRDLGRVHER